MVDDPSVPVYGRLRLTASDLRKHAEEARKTAQNFLDLAEDLEYRASAIEEAEEVTHAGHVSRQ